MSKTGILKEPTVTENADEQEPHTEFPGEIPAPNQEALPAPFAVTPLEEAIIEGEITAVIEPEPSTEHARQKPWYLLVVATVLVCLLFLAVSLLLPLLTPSATVFVIPVERTVSATETIQVQGRLLSSLTLTESQSIAASGHKHRDATKAEGIITFYNGLFTSQTVAAGTVLTGSDGVQIITEQPAIIPSGNPPIYGRVAVSAHAVRVGPQGNIPAYDIDQACCLTSVLAKNSEPFTGGQDARDYIVVTQTNIDAAASTLKTALNRSLQAALNTQLNLGEGLITLPCTLTTTADHQAGDEATEVHVTVSDTCSGVAYDTQALHRKATQTLTQEAARRLGADYSLIGDVQTSILHATITDKTHSIATLTVKVAGGWVYLVTPSERQYLAHSIAGRSRQQAIYSLLRLPWIRAVDVTGDLPDDPNHIQIVVIYK